MMNATRFDVSGQFLSWVEAPIRDVLRLGYSKTQGCEPTRVNQLAVNHWMIWQQAICETESGVQAYHKLLFRQLSDCGLSHGIIREFDSMVINEAIELILHRGRHSPIGAAENLRRLIDANTRVLVSYMRNATRETSNSAALVR